jgi:hypothetical protein
VRWYFTYNKYGKQCLPQREKLKIGLVCLLSKICTRTNSLPKPFKA